MLEAGNRVWKNTGRVVLHANLVFVKDGAAIM
jgi:hypothetical protein